MSNALEAVILAGGLGTRLRSVVADRPKVLAEIAGRPFITRLLDQLVDVGMQRVVLCTVTVPSWSKRLWAQRTAA